jgi:vitamin B12 transporter
MRAHAKLAAGASLAALAAAAPAAAQEAIEVPEIVVSGGLTPVPVSEYGRAYTVITAEEIERRQLAHVADVLRTVPGVSVTRTGSVGGNTVVRIRGSESNHALVLIDGVEVNAPENGEYDFAGLLAADIARIEVLRGPQSALYGGDALGGVISIVTKGAEEPGVTAGGSLEGGTDETFGGDAFVRARTERGAISFSIAGRRTGGFDISGSPSNIEDRDANVTANLKGELDAADWLTLGGTLRLTERSSDFDGFEFGAPTVQGLVVERDLARERTELFGSAFADISTLGGRLTHGARISYTHADDQNLTDGVVDTDTTATRLSLDWRSTLALDAPTLGAADHTLTLAADFERETFTYNGADLVFDPSQLDVQERNLFGLVGEYRGTFLEALDVQLGVRHDFNDDFEDATTFSAGLAYRVAATDTRLHASVGRGVQNPTFFEQFGFIPDQFLPNPDLEPEESLGWDIGVEQTLLDGRAVVDVTYFRQDLENEIVTVFPPPDFIGTVVNEEGESERQGVEVSADLTPLDGLSLGLTYTYTDADDPDGAREVRRPRHQAGLTATYAFPGERASVTAEARWVADQRDFDFTEPAFGNARIGLDDYVLVNLAGRYRVNEAVEVFARVENLTDVDYQEVLGYETQGITGFAGLKVTW